MTMIPQEIPPEQITVKQRIRMVTDNYLVRKILKALITSLAAVTFTFFLIRLMPSNPIELYMQQLIDQYGIPYNEARDQAAALFAIDLDQPVILQYFEFLGNLLRGDFGVSIISPGTPVSDIIKRFLPWTIFSVGIGLMISFILGFLLGLLMAYRRETLLDHALTFFASIFTSIPDYLVAILVIVTFGIQMDILPIAEMRGTLSPGVEPELSLAFIKDVFFHASVPIAVYVVTTIGRWMLTMKSSTINVLEEDYVTIARAKGLKDSRILVSYVGRNASLPLFTQLAIAIGFVVGGSLLIETIFRYQGIGLTMIQSVQRRDYTLMQGIFIILIFAVVFANFFADILYSWIDPRIRLEEAN